MPGVTGKESPPVKKSPPSGRLLWTLQQQVINHLAAECRVQVSFAYTSVFKQLVKLQRVDGTAFI